MLEEERRLQSLPWPERYAELDRLRRECWAEIERLRRCPVCGGSLVAAGRVQSLTDKCAVYCSSKCKQKAYRDRGRVTPGASFSPPVTRAARCSCLAGWVVESARGAQERRACSAQLELSLGVVVGPVEHERVAVEGDVADRVTMPRRGGVDQLGAVIVADQEPLGDARC
jgi:hypothetical protein